MRLGGYANKDTRVDKNKGLSFTQSISEWQHVISSNPFLSLYNIRKIENRKKMAISIV